MFVFRIRPICPRMYVYILVTRTVLFISLYYIVLSKRVIWEQIIIINSYILECGIPIFSDNVNPICLRMYVYNVRGHLNCPIHFIMSFVNVLLENKIVCMKSYILEFTFSTCLVEWRFPIFFDYHTTDLIMQCWNLYTTNVFIGFDDLTYIAMDEIEMSVFLKCIYS